jgi:hypothetical protein
LPDQVPNEVTPHILWMRDHAPDQPGPLLWVYPFDEYHDWTFGTPTRIEEVFFGDWFMRGAINQGLPLNTVISTGNLASTMASHPERLAESILISPVPDADTAWEQALYDHWERGGRVLLYGPLDHASPELAEFLGCELAEPLDGDFELSVTGCPDVIETAWSCATPRCSPLAACVPREPASRWRRRARATPSAWSPPPANAWLGCAAPWPATRTTRVGTC